MRATIILAGVLAALQVEAQPTPASVAFLVHETDDAAIEAPLRSALQEEAPALRIAAARVAIVRGVESLLPELREALKVEKNDEAARELVRAIAILGGRKEIEFLLVQVRRFGTKLDGALASAVARRGAPEAIEIYLNDLRGLASLGDTTNFFKLAFWSKTQFVNSTLDRLIQLQDFRGFAELLEALEQSNLLPDINRLIAAVKSSSDEIRIPTGWFLARSLACDGELPACRIDIPPEGRTLLIEKLSSTEKDELPVSLSFARELQRRILGMEAFPDRPRPTPRTAEWLVWLRTEEAFDQIDPKLVKYLTDEEQEGIRAGEPEERGPKGPGQRSQAQRAHYRLSDELPPPPFRIPTPLPGGLSGEVMNASRCKDQWIGLGRAGVDDRGRVVGVDVSKIETTAPCRQALETLVRMSLPVNSSMLSPRHDLDFLVVKARGTGICLDEPLLDQPGGLRGAEFLHRSPRITPPVVKRRVDPQFSHPARHKMSSDQVKSGLVVVEAIISSTGCVRDLRLVNQLPIGDLNRSALLAASQWKFEPGKIDGKPTPVIFNLTINFQLN